MILQKLASVCLILFQLAALLGTSIGAAYWIKRLSFRQWLVKFTAATLGVGLAAVVVVLQILVYLDIRLGISSWMVLTFGIVGFVFEVRNFLQVKSAMHRRHWLHLRALAVIFVGVFAIQGAGLLYWGPARYYGSAHYDLANYVAESQFLIDKRFSTTYTDVGLHPYLLKAIQNKNFRNGPCIANGYLAVVTGGDAQSTYGTLSVFFICLLGCCIYELMRSFSISITLSMLGGIWAACLPCITKIHLDNFFSQEAVLFVFPSVVCLFRNFRHSPRTVFVVATVLMAYLLGAYTEMLVFGLLYSFLLSFTYLRSRLHRKIIFVIALASASLLIDPFCTKLMWQFVKSQYKIAGSAYPVLEALYPFSGTWQGWAQSLFGYENKHTQFFVIIALGLLAVSLSAFFSKQSRTRCELFLIVAPYLGPLVWLISKPVFIKYPFAKILDSFAPLTLMLFIIGADRIGILLTVAGSRLHRRDWIYSVFTPICLVPFFALSLSGSFFQMKQILLNRIALSSVNAESCIPVYRELKQSRNEIFTIAENDPLVVAWMAYYARNNNVYLCSEKIFDVPTGSEWAFKKVPYGDSTIKIVTSRGIFPSADVFPEISIDNPQGTDVGDDAHWYWIEDECSVQIIKFGTASDKLELSFMATAGPASISPLRSISLTPIGSHSEPITLSFKKRANLSFPITLDPGINRFKLKIIAPGATVQNSNSALDQRIFLLRAEDFQIKKALFPK